MKIAFTFMATFLIAWIGGKPLIRWLDRHNMRAESTARGMHAVPTPVGGGWLAAPPALFTFAFFTDQQEVYLRSVTVIAALALMLVSWRDDRNFVRPSVRFALQAMAVAAVLSLLPADDAVFSRAWPLWADRLLTALFWLWFINLFNFMDGIDGLAASETIIVAGGLIIIGFLVALDAGALHTAAALAGAAAGFLRWNWYRAKLFLGDVGAIPIGFLLGFLLIRLALQGHLAAALILPGYFIADASLTLLRRVFEGKPFWRPHREHFFQRATLAHGNHARTVLTVLPVNIGLVMLAIAAIDHPLTASLAAIGVLAMLLLVLQLQARS